MADPEVDHGFIYNDKGQVDILKSPFFDFTPEIDQSVEEYVDRIIFQLAATIEEQISCVQWMIVSNAKKSTDDENHPMLTNSSGDEISQPEGNLMFISVAFSFPLPVRFFSPGFGRSLAVSRLPLHVLLQAVAFGRMSCNASFVNTTYSQAVDFQKSPAIACRWDYGVHFKSSAITHGWAALGVSLPMLLVNASHIHHKPITLIGRQTIVHITSPQLLPVVKPKRTKEPRRLTERIKKEKVDLYKENLHNFIPLIEEANMIADKKNPTVVGLNLVVKEGKIY
ncbi:hypothetical protein M5K25_001993 [Dendrobium thyrsiflorum]|uniref:Uncharacterized protein n=1 Tax=Dendrobium thyrsiflorum TaxID=117978 RepID=A0ABD0VT65_DENTH